MIYEELVCKHGLKEENKSHKQKVVKVTDALFPQGGQRSVGATEQGSISRRVVFRPLRKVKSIGNRRNR